MEVARKVGLKTEGVEEKDISTTVKEWLDSDKSDQWLVIFDNIDDPDILRHIRAMLPTQRGNSITKP